MKGKMLLSLAVAVLGLTFSGLAQDSIVRVRSQDSFDQIVAKVQSATSQNGLMAMGHLNQGQMLSMTGLQLKGESFLLGNPRQPRRDLQPRLPDGRRMGRDH